MKDKEEKSLIARFFTPKPDVMVAAGEQARSLAKALRAMKTTQGQHFEAYVFHTKYGSMVCVGQFDSADDPKLMEMQQQLGTLKFNIAPASAGDAPGPARRTHVRPALCHAGAVVREEDD